MNRSDHAARSGALARARLAGVRLVATLAMLLGALMVGSPSAGAQGSGNSFDYDENGLQWSISWDDSIWSEGGGASSADFALQANNSSVQFLVLSNINESPAACLEGLVPSFEDGAGVTDAVDFEDDNGDPVAADTDAYAYEIRTVTVPAGGSDLQADTIHACYDLDGSSLLWVVALVPTDSGELGDVFDLYDNIEVAGDPVPLGLTDIVSGARSGTPEASASRRSSRSPEASPSDEVTPKASPSRRSSRSPEASPSGSETGADQAAGTYTSPNFGYTLAWNPDDWDVDQELPNSGGRDRLDLFGAGSPYIIYIEGSDEWSNPDDCVATLSGEVSDFNPDNADPVLDANDDPFVISGDDRSLAAYLNTSRSGDTIALFECRADPDSDLIVAFSFLSGDTNNFVENVYPDFADVADSLTFEGFGSGNATPVASRRAETDATPEASRSANTDATPEVSPSPRPSRSARPSPSDDATPEASRRGSTGDTGVIGDGYISPTYGYQLSWDGDVWTVEDESSADDVDALTLSSDLLTLNVTGYNSGDGATDTCFDNVVTVLNDRGDGNAEILNGDDGNPIGASDDTDTSGQRFVAYSVDGTQFGSLVTCVSLDSENVLALEFTAVPDDLLSDDATTQISDIFDTLSL